MRLKINCCAFSQRHKDELTKKKNYFSAMQSYVWEEFIFYFFSLHRIRKISPVSNAKRKTPI